MLAQDMRRLFEIRVVAGGIDNFGYGEEDVFSRKCLTISTSNVDTDWLVRQVFKYCDKELILYWLELIIDIIESRGILSEKQKCIDLLKNIMTAKCKYLCMNWKEELFGTYWLIEARDKTPEASSYRRVIEMCKLATSYTDRDRIKIRGKEYNMIDGIGNTIMLKDVKTGDIKPKEISLILVKRNGKVEVYEGAKLHNYSTRLNKIRQVGLDNIDLIIRKANWKYEDYFIG